ncbi:MAG TPA: PKD domain-containing protein [Bryobacteraceae bacterium]|nr:PKD domain-containing protein [Bryobacteraceae bacterium]
MRTRTVLLCFALLALAAGPLPAIERPDKTFPIFQFPADQIPRIDGQTDDWDMVPEEYVIGTDQLADTVGGHGTKIDRKNLDVRVRVGWVKGMNRLYFLYEAYDNYWDFARPDLHNDIFELVVDGDLSGGPLIEEMHPNKLLDRWDAHFRFHGVHAQNYHIFTPAKDKDWTMVWGCQPWIKDLPWANAAYSYNFKPGESGKLVLEFWITPFDYAGCEGPQRAVESVLAEDKLIGMSWSVLDYDDVNAKTYSGFWNLSHKTTMYGDASDLVLFRLMPLEAKLRKPVEARWSFQVVDMDRRLVAFRDESYGRITSWKWDFGDNTTSTERHPVHAYQKPGEYIVTLSVDGPGGSARHTKVWDVTVP